MKEIKKKNLVKKVFERNDTEYKISFETKDGELMVNATQMGSVFGENKKPQKFLRNAGVKSFINELKKENGANLSRSYVSEPYIVYGDEVRPSLRGTWMHEKLALRYAMWLSPSFHLWVVNQMMELLKTGSVELNQPKLQQMQEHLDLQTQRDNTKDVARKIYTETKGDVGSIPKYHYQNLMKFTGLSPKDWRDIGKAKGLPKSTTSKGGKEIVRVLNPEIAAAMSLADNMFAATKTLKTDDQQYVVDVAKSGIKMFEGMIKLGIIPQEVRK